MASVFLSFSSQVSFSSAMIFSDSCVKIPEAVLQFFSKFFLQYTKQLKFVLSSKPQINFVYKTYSQHFKTLSLSSLMFVRVNSLEGELRKDNFITKHSQTLIRNTEISLTHTPSPTFFFFLNLIYRHHSVTGCQGTAETTQLFPWQQRVSNRKGICRVCSSPLQSLWQCLMDKT